VVVDQETGMLVPIGDFAGLAESVVALLSDEQRRKQMGARAREVANAKFSLSRMVDQIEQIYRN
jgi:glycosyltransferase involved in cell wall biosynthesis